MASAWSACRRCWRSRTSWRGRSAISPHRATRRATRKAFTTTMRRRSWFACCRCARAPDCYATHPRRGPSPACSGAAGARSGKSPAGPSGHAAAAASSRCSVVTTACSPFAAKWPRRCVRCSPNSPSRWTRSISTRRPSTWSGNCPPSVPNSPSANMPGNCRKDSSCACKARVYGTTTGRPWSVSASGPPPSGNWPATGCADYVATPSSSRWRPTWTRRWRSRCWTRRCHDGSPRSTCASRSTA
ncbi:hypothetical protein PAERUG_P47_London_12_VIM_2_12_12_03461 [Pseudomonas aeruginosa]|nr:hypothetical protein PAERUG_P47_London_12_VIM_2_12_12_03461 [Pseudomonas aeruginosa]